MHSVQQKLRSSATSERSWQQSTGLLLQRLILLSRFHIVRLTCMLLWQWVRSYDSQWNKHDCWTYQSLPAEMTHIHRLILFLLLHEVICKVCKTGTICVILREVPFLCDILKHTQHIYMISHSSNKSEEWKCCSSPRTLGRILLEATLQCKWFCYVWPLLFWRIQPIFMKKLHNNLSLPAFNSSQSWAFPSVDLLSVCLVSVNSKGDLRL